MIEANSNLGREKFEILMKFVKMIISSLTVSRKEARVGAVVFGSRPKRVFGFEEEKSAEEAVEAIDNFK